MSAVPRIHRVLEGWSAGRGVRDDRSRWRARWDVVGMTARALMAVGWAGVLVLLGLWATLTGAEQAPGLGSAVRVAGWAALAGGQFVFMVLVADHFFPRASRRVIVAIEALALVAFLVGLVAVLVQLAVWTSSGELLGAFIVSPS